MQNTYILLILLACLLLPSWLYAKDIVPQLTLAKIFTPQNAQQSFWVSEKLDGIRCYWNGENLLTRNGKKIHAPDWFIEKLPKQTLDGELWMGRGSFSLLSKTVLDDKPDAKLWKQVSYQVFDLPNNPAPFELRQAQLKKTIERIKLPHVQMVEQVYLKNNQEIEQHLHQLVELGAEGIMLRTPNSVYQAGRSNDLLKMKLRQDAEAKVIAYQAGRGKYENMMGAIWVEMPDGRLFKIGTGFSDHERQNPPPIGSDITYSHEGYTSKGLPKFASFQRIKIEE